MLRMSIESILKGTNRSDIWAFNTLPITLGATLPRNHAWY